MGRKARDFTNQTIGHVKVLYIDDSKPRGSGKNIYWICQCNCGNFFSVSTSSLQTAIRTSNNNYSCSKCRKTPLKNLTGQRFGKLTVIEIDKNRPATKENNWAPRWICRCDCGNITSVLSNNLLRKHTTSCGCINYSIGEENIKNLLIKNNINFKTQYSFSDLIDKGKLRFDFAIFSKNNELIELIEFDGRQHKLDYTPWLSTETLKERQYRDLLKTKYCEKHNIKLIRINYEERDNISLERLGLNNYE